MFREFSAIISSNIFSGPFSLLLKWSEVTQLCPTLCDPMDCSPPGSSVHGIFQARVLEWVTISFSRGSSHPRDRTRVSRTTGICFTIWAIREAPVKYKGWHKWIYLQNRKRITDIEIRLLVAKGDKDGGEEEGWSESLRFSSVAQLCPTLCNPMNHSPPGLPVHHQLPEFTQTHVHRVSDAIQPSHPLSSPSSPVPNPSQHQGLLSSSGTPIMGMLVHLMLP